MFSSRMKVRRMGLDRRSKPWHTELVAAMPLLPWIREQRTCAVLVFTSNQEQGHRATPTGPAATVEVRDGMALGR